MKCVGYAFSVEAGSVNSVLFKANVIVGSNGLTHDVATVATNASISITYIFFITIRI